MQEPVVMTETSRLLLRQLTVEDAEFFYRLNDDPEVLKYTGDKPFKDIEEAHTFLSNYDQYKQYGFGRWAVIEKQSQNFIGWCGLKYTPAANEHDLGFRFFKSQWGNGFATEASKACIALGFEHFKLPIIIGRATKQNTASIRVLEKTGFSFQRLFDFDGHNGVIYTLEKRTPRD